MHPDRGDSPSQLRLYLALLGLEEGPGAAAARDSAVGRAEVERWHATPLLRLRLPRRRWLPPPAWALAAAVSLLIGAGVWRRGEDDLRPKGASAIEIFAERDGRVFPWTEGMAPAAFGRVRVQVSAGQRLDAFLLVAGRSGAWLTPLADAWQARMALAAGQTSAFAGSYALVGSDDGERLAVALCAPAAIGSAEALAQAVAGAAAAAPAQTRAGPCELRWFRLR